MLFREIIDSPCGIRFMADTLEMRSAAGRRLLMQSPMLESAAEIELAFAKLREFHQKLIVDQATQRRSVGRILGIKLQGLKDCDATLRQLAAGRDGDEVCFFELKSLALLCDQISPLLLQAGITSIHLPDLQVVKELLDPDHTGIASFYIYDSYNQELGRLRQQIRSGKGDKNELLMASRMIEQQICQQLTTSIRPELEHLRTALTILAEIDLLLAKARQMERFKLTFPSLSTDEKTSYQGLFHPQVCVALEASGKSYQPVELTFGLMPVTVIGANMGGKTVLLRSLALSQYLFQFGFGVPAAMATIRPIEQLYLRIGDAEANQGGLSSFASEITEIGTILTAVRSCKRVLVLLDEPARTTNPVEGAALVSALVNLLGQSGASCVLTTHYNLLQTKSRRLKVRGLSDKGMDYTLTEVADGEVPHEALAVARMLGVDAEWIGGAQQLLDQAIKHS
ncbi:MAG: hypothetical protein RR330_02780 [Alistipes sp.]